MGMNKKRLRALAVDGFLKEIENLLMNLERGQRLRRANYRELKLECRRHLQDYRDIQKLEEDEI